MARCLISGIAGFLGSHLADRLLTDGHQVIGVDSLLGGEQDNVPEGVRFFEDNCCDMMSMRGLMNASRPDVVFHLAATPHEGLSVFSPCVVTTNTYLSTVSLASAACHARVKRFVFTSSMARYGRAENPPFDERQPPVPVDPYGIAKVASEDVLRILGKQHGMEWVILVPHNIVGERQRYTDPYRNVAAIMINRLLRGKQPVIYGDGEQKRCFSYVGDCVECIARAGFLSRAAGEIINIGPDDDPVTINWLAGMIYSAVAQVSGGGLPGGFAPIYLPARPCEVKEAWPSSDKARRLLGFEPKTPLAEMIARMVRDILERGPREFEYHLPLEIVSEAAPKTWTERSM